MDSGNSLDTAGMHHHHHHHHHHYAGGATETQAQAQMGHSDVTVTVGGPSVMGLRGNSQFSNSNMSMNSSNSSSSQELTNLSAIVATASITDCCSNSSSQAGSTSGNNVMSFEETKQLLAKHLQETTSRQQNRSCCQNSNELNTTSYHEEEANFDGIDLGGDDSTPVALGEILEKLQEETAELTSSHSKQDLNDFIRLHSGDHATISATVNVATLDLSDPDSIHQHLSQLNDTVLRVTAHESSTLNLTTSSSTTTTPSNSSATATSTSCSTREDFYQQQPQQSDGNQQHQQQKQSNPISISISPTSSCNNSSTSVAAVQTDNNSTSLTSALTISTSSKSSTTTTVATTASTPSATTPTRKSGSSSGSKASPQSCSVCSKVFSNASALAKHRLTHSEERRYHCNICGKAFKRQDHLNGHLLTHRSTKPFACHVEGCGKSYCDARSLRRHKENHHGQAKLDKSSASDNQTSSSSTGTEKQQSNVDIISGPDHLISKSNVLGDTKIRFSSKGLTAQQLQLIEQLFKQSKSKQESNKNTSTTTPTTPLNTNGKVAASKSANNTGTSASSSSSPNASLGDNSKQQLPDKPVECTICSRKFKNIPALNGHMRLHGGYYKKDADGRRLVGGMSNNNPLNKVSGLQQAQLLKRKAIVTSNGGKDQSEPAQKKCSSVASACTTASAPATISVTYCPQPQVSSLPSFAFSNLPQPDTSKLLANLELKAKEMMTTPSSCTEAGSNTTVPDSPNSGSSAGSSSSVVQQQQSSNNTSTTSSLRALRKPAHPSKKGGVPSPPEQGACNNDQSTTHIASLMSTHPLSLPLVALPTKPLPVQMASQAAAAVTTTQNAATTEDDQKVPAAAAPYSLNNTSIQITALIQSNPIVSTCNQVVNNSHHNEADFHVVQASTHDMISPLISCMQQSISDQHYNQANCFSHHHAHHNSHHEFYPKTSNLLKVDQSKDSNPRIGEEYQVEIPELQCTIDIKPPFEEEAESPALWRPSTADCLSDVELSQYLLVASSCVVGGGSHNEEVALEILQKHGGNVQNALQDLLSSYDTSNIEEDSLSLFSSQESDSEDDTQPAQSSLTPYHFSKSWQPYEVDLFYEGLVRYHKDFNKVSKHVATKSVKDCVEFYYLWKNICFEESQSFKSLFAQALSSVSSEPGSSNAAAAESSTSINEPVASLADVVNPLQSSHQPPQPSNVSSVVT